MLYIVLVSRLSLDKFCIECFCIYSSAMAINATKDKCSATVSKMYVSGTNKYFSVLRTRYSSGEILRYHTKPLKC